MDNLVTRSVLAIVSAAMAYVMMPQTQSQTGQGVASITQRYKQQVENIDAGEVISTLKLIQDQLVNNTKSMDAVNADLAAINQVVGDLNNTLENIVNDKIVNGKFVSKKDLEEAVAATKEAVAQVKAESDGTCDCDAKFTEIFQRLAALENITGLSQTMYANVSTTTSSGGCTGSLVQSYQNTVTNYGSVSGGSGGGSTGSYTPATTTRNVRVVEPRKVQPRRVTNYEVAEPAPVSVAPVTSTCVARDPITGECLQSVQAPVAKEVGRVPLLQRVFGR